MQSHTQSGSGSKKITAYHQYMKENLPKYKKEHPDMSHKDAFSAVAKMWKENPAGLRDAPEE
ncbi:hypothetical protein BBP40_005981 [Aspergillus hancockii]|nr:hypothetical protein BBP40_005981 [Aspergillus hancockii]